MTSEGGALEHVEETSKLYRETTVPVEIKQPTAGGYLRVSKHSKIRQIELLVTISTLRSKVHRFAGVRHGIGFR